ncbi:hypothetical protein BOQ63_001470 (plasmid) [Streptomyces viridifaciens]|nr:hypothetical protein BOQ63_001470 [Streptomyces viridifaciens]
MNDHLTGHESEDQQHRGILVRVVAPSVPTCAAVLSSGSVGTILISGTVPPNSPLVWPLVVLALGSMAYDLGARALRR